jgi:hypothetical protein
MSSQIDRFLAASRPHYPLVERENDANLRRPSASYPHRQKRGGKPAGHHYGKKLLKIIEARDRVYRAAYEWMLQHKADPALLAHFVEQARRGVAQHFHHVSDNGDINNPDEGWAHAAVLVQWLNRKCRAL